MCISVLISRICIMLLVGRSPMVRHHSREQAAVSDPAGFMRQSNEEFSKRASSDAK